ncbi:group III truncated hemoglobin [Phaeobacter gallaeciensis]|uniref:Hemoglobin, trunc n=1 Tax=Phaeobacter gallaeciensis TaxID=60890 RepID=A0AAC9Z7V6_9RHOB|nr:group III truncated hemoglobin [Phaeobacter gallaeciensis]AHD08894.1 Hemoglobin, trunc [Phaeobacter gallaeciensis DSM 26640]ATE92160.1 Hemoglobin, trunc [Phaeobacter gallaeciensis]ATE98021.1 Hemoglobin, trunc [Phaeobacter gallaeciensis]ATF00822.1 Hemoglobin, trunc [Phaeobacter gallaeciensis]ATF05202.1 Hemoglobin, trunc [Phaeobacter gallaeciensis]
MAQASDPRAIMFEVTAAEIRRLVANFYARIRRHDELGPVFNAVIGDWPEHEAKIEAFWRGAILREPGYLGNPMQVHLANAAIKPEHFPLWLDLFRDTAKRELKPETAAAFASLADRIGKGLSYGIENFRGPEGAPPVLR